MVCKHKYVFRGSDSFYYESGRYCNTYVHIDHYFCEKCLDEKEKKKQVDVNINDRPPDWAVVITNKRR